MLGEHLIKCWSINQAVIALSSGEAEYYAMAKGASIGLGIQGMLDDFGISGSIEVRTDSSAAKGICSRRGLGKVRHIELCELWLQEKVAEGKITIVKIPGAENISDCLTKAAARESIVLHTLGTHQVIRKGRHRIMPILQVSVH